MPCCFCFIFIVFPFCLSFKVAFVNFLRGLGLFLQLPFFFVSTFVNFFFCLSEHIVCCVIGLLDFLFKSFLQFPFLFLSFFSICNIINGSFILSLLLKIFNFDATVPTDDHRASWGVNLVDRSVGTRKFREAPRKDPSMFAEFEFWNHLGRLLLL